VSLITEKEYGYMNNNTEVISQTVAQAGSAVTAGSLFWAWIGTNHWQLQVIFGFIGAMGVIGGAVVNWNHKQKVLRLMKNE